MKNFFKKLTLVSVFLSVFTVLFAEPASTGLTDSDVKNWAKNLNSIVKDLNSIGAWSEESINVTAKQKNAVDSVLNKYGISGTNCIEKFAMITGSAVVIVAESELDAQSAALLKSLGVDPMAEIRKNVNSKDFAIVQANSKAVVKAYNNLDTSSIDSASAPLPDSSTYEDYYSKLSEAFANQVAGMNEDDKETADAIKKLYEQLSKAKGDSGYIYKKKTNASKYKKSSPKKGTVILTEAGYDANTLNWTFDLDAKKAKLEFNWGGKNSKSINYTINGIEYYYLKENSELGGESKEYVISTKEGLVFHFYDEWDFSGNAFKKEFGIKGVANGQLEVVDILSWRD